MATVDGLRPEIARLVAAKEQRRRRLAKLPFPDKVRMVVELQHMTAPILRARGWSVPVWQIDAGSVFTRS